MKKIIEDYTQNHPSKPVIPTQQESLSVKWGVGGAVGCCSGRRVQAPSQSMGEQVQAQHRESAMQDNIDK